MVFLLLLKTLKEPHHFGSEKIEGKKNCLSVQWYSCVCRMIINYSISSTTASKFQKPTMLSKENVNPTQIACQHMHIFSTFSRSDSSSL